MEKERLKVPDWKKWGPYLTERQWGTVREDYSANGEAWEYTTHDMAPSKAWRWGEEGIAGFSDKRQRICFSVGFWNKKDPILKERLFGLTSHEGNHGEDVKELYYYLDSSPTHSYMKMLYKYPQAAFPYEWLVGGEQAADPGSAGVRADGYRDLRPRQLLRHLYRICQGGHGGHPCPDHRSQSGPECGSPSRPAHYLVPEHLELGL